MKVSLSLDHLTENAKQTEHGVELKLNVKVCLRLGDKKKYIAVKVIKFMISIQFFSK